MEVMRACKAVIYPLGGVMQFYLASQSKGHAAGYVLLGIVLIGLGILNLHRLTSGEKVNSAPRKQAANERAESGTEIDTR